MFGFGAGQRSARDSARVRLWPLILLLSVGAALAGCSKEPGDANPTAGRQLFNANANTIGEQRYRCSDGSQWHVDTLGDGLTITLTPMPTGKQERLDTPAQGLTYVGDRIAATFSKNALTIERSDGPAVACQRN